MKVIFLDFDGVLNSMKWYKRRKEMGMEIPTSFLHRSQYELDEAAVKMMSDFVKEVQASVVVSSSWRILHPIEELREIVKVCGWDAPEFIDVTPRSEKGFRGGEVGQWLKQTYHTIQSHVIFDDDGDFYPDQPLVKTSWELGLEQHHIDQAREILLK